jgi:methylglyoxal/glyoxal reductase
MDLTSTVTLNNGVRIPWVGFGVFQVEPGEETYRSVATALEAGYRAVDTAALYGNEADVGRAVRESGLSREEVFVTTKVWNDMQGYEPALKAFESSRKKLDLDPIDLYLIHWPCPAQDRYRDTWKAMSRLYADGAVRSIGVSNFTIGQLETLMDSSDVVPVVNQVEFHPFLYQADLLAFCREHHIRLEAWSPLTRGRSLGNPVIQEVARGHGRSPAQVLIRWCLQHEVVVLPRSTKEAHIRENADVFDFELSGQEMERLDGLNEGARIGPDPERFG